MKPILLYEFNNAPDELKALSEHGGDEDGIALIPSGIEIPWWLERLWKYDDCEPIILENGDKVFIWAHA